MYPPYLAQFLEYVEQEFDHFQGLDILDNELYLKAAAALVILRDYLRNELEESKKYEAECQAER